MKNLGNFIRDFTLIDFMGMLFPGSVLLLLLQMDYNLWVKLYRAWGAAPETGVRVAFILIGGYFVGTLLMELGDFLEQFIWKNPLLNPRSWAASSTGLYNQVTQTSSKPKWHTLVNWIRGFLLAAIIFLILFFSGIFAILLRYISSWTCIVVSLIVLSLGIAKLYIRETQKHDKAKCHYIIGSLLGVGISCILFCLGVVGLSEQSIFSWICIGLYTIVFYVGIYLILDDIFQRRFMNYDQKKLLYIQQNDSIYMGFLPHPQLRTKAQKAEESQKREALKSKQTLFDGFRIMSRNMLLVFILVCAYGRYSGKMLHDYYQKLTTDIAGCSILFIILLLLSIRYWRFSYLKYKYYYEVFVSYGKSNSVAQGTSDTNNSSIQNENTADNNTVHNAGAMS